MSLLIKNPVFRASTACMELSCCGQLKTQRTLPKAQISLSLPFDGKVSHDLQTDALTHYHLAHKGPFICIDWTSATRIFRFWCVDTFRIAKFPVRCFLSGYFQKNTHDVISYWVRVLYPRISNVMKGNSSLTSADDTIPSQQWGRMRSWDDIKGLDCKYQIDDGQNFDWVKKH